MLGNVPVLKNAWGREWRGLIHEAVLIGPGGNEAVISVAASLLAATWRVPGIPRVTAAQIMAAKDAGLADPHGFLKTIMMLK